MVPFSSIGYLKLAQFWTPLWGPMTNLLVLCVVSVGTKFGGKGDGLMAAGDPRGKYLLSDSYVLFLSRFNLFSTTNIGIEISTVLTPPKPPTY